MADIDRQKLRSVSDLVRKGGKLLGEPCPKCGGVLVQYQGRTICANCDDLSLIEKTRIAPAPTDISARLRNLASSKIEETAKLLESETDPEKQVRLAELLLRYIEILNKISEYDRSAQKEKQQIKAAATTSAASTGDTSI
ncbi:MAG: hypothetical protein M1503_05015 [Thaumarchaeota archaeon]|nr:hypothetical protein [Nitrososphaerota archaeon]MCL5317613.1 hypothetical protein [Nitrososphaerota archaeon]